MVKNGQYRLSGLDEKIIALHARGMSFRDIQAQLQEMYGVEVSPTLISNVTDAVIDEVKQWQNRPLDVVVHPIVFLDCLVIKVRDNLQQLPIKRTTRIILKALLRNAFKIILGSDLSAKRCK